MVADYYWLPCDWLIGLIGRLVIGFLEQANLMK